MARGHPIRPAHRRIKVQAHDRALRALITQKIGGAGGRGEFDTTLASVAKANFDISNIWNFITKKSKLTIGKPPVQLRRNA